MGIDCNTAHVRKQKLAYLLNCRMSEQGRNVSRLYLVVDTQLDLYFFLGGVGTSTIYYNSAINLLSIDDN